MLQFRYLKELPYLRLQSRQGSIFLRSAILKNINEIGACRMCLVEIKGAKALQAACVYPVAEGNEIYTSSPAVREARKINLSLLLSNHKKECLTCAQKLRTASFRLCLKSSA